MPQTMLAMLAMALATLVSVHQMRSTARTRMNMIRHEVSSQATAVAVDRLDEIASMDFDENTIGGKLIANAAGLTVGPPFANDSHGNDIDDFHGVVLDTFRVAGTNKLHFRVRSKVGYADENNPNVVVAGPGKLKRATVEVYSLIIPNPDTIRLSQTFACGSNCTW